MKSQLTVNLRKGKKEFKKGQVLTDVQIQKYGIKSVYLTPVISGRRNQKKEEFTSAEENMLVDLYMEIADPINNRDNRAEIIAEFRTVFDRHSDDSLEIYINGLKRIDYQYLAQGMAPKASTVKRLHTIYPDRFMSIDEVNWTTSMV